jgi:putative heme-binding domain-containing protein
MYEDRYMPRNPCLAAPAPLLDIAQDGPAAEVYRISPVEPWRIIRTRMRVKGIVQGLIEGGGRPAGYFTSATGITVYTGDAWPKPFHGNAFIGEVAGNLVHRKRLESDGVGLVAQRIEQGEEFLASSDNWFRPVQFANAPDGTLYIADMYREFIEMPTAVPSVITQQVDWTSGRARGRIYRVVPDGFQQRPSPRLGEAATSELVTTLEHPNGWHRETASRLLYERQDRAAVGPLATLARASSMPHARMHALYALDGLAALNDAVLLQALDDPHPRVREHAVGLTERLCRNSPEIQAKLYAMADDVDPRVRYQLAFTLGELIASGPDVARADTNPRSQHGSGQDSPPLRVAVRGHSARVPQPRTIQSGCLDALARLAATDAGDPWVRLAVVSSANDRAIELFVTLGDNRSLRRCDGAVALLGSLAECIGARHRPDEMGVLMKWLEALPDDDNATGLAVLSGLEQGLFRSGNSLSQLGRASAQPRVTSLVEGVLTGARATATDHTQPLNDRLQAVHALRLGNFAQVRPTLSDLLDLRHPQEVQRAAVETLVRFDEPEVARVVLTRWPQLSPGVRRHAVDGLFSRGDWLAELLEAIRTDQMSASDLHSAQVQLALSYKDPAVRQKAKAVLVGFQPGRRQEVVAAYHDALQLSRDAARGKVVFSRVCAACHRLDARGYEVGPDLATIKNRGAEAILLNVLDPNREVDPQYVNFTVATTDGRVLTGMIGAETATSITLRGADGASATVLRSTIDAVKNTGMSFMPEGLERDLSKQDLADLIEYLAQER